MLTDADYIQKSICPICESQEIEGGQWLSINENTITARVCCLKCNAEWQDVYQLTGYILIKKET